MAELAASSARRTVLAAGGLIAVVLAAVTVGAQAASSSHGRDMSYWAVTVSLRQTTTWEYDWDRTETIDVGGTTYRCTRSEHGRGNELLRLRSVRRGVVRLLPRNGRVRISRSRSIAMRGTQRRVGRLVRAVTGDPAGCNTRSDVAPTNQCGLSRRRDLLRVLGIAGRRHFRLVSAGAGRSPRRCPSPPHGAAKPMSVLAQPNVAWGRVQTTTGKLISARKLADPRTTSMTVLLSYRGTTGYEGRDPERPEQEGSVVTSVRAAVTFRRLVCSRGVCRPA
ncbi:MAG: hypothetical protein M3M94_02260 [Actinomycetota bacterium]|nr:hypothetical protein [Actinomycetota bacterium]